MSKRRNSEPNKRSASTVSALGRLESSSNNRELQGGTILVRSKSLPLIHGCIAYGPLIKTKGILKGSSVPNAIETTRRDNSDDLRSKHVSPKIMFADINIREYARTVGDNPSCSSGPPISISWEYDPNTKIFSVEDYERERPPRRSNIQMVVPRSIRTHMLRKEWGVSQSQIAAAIRSNLRVKNQRRATINRSPNSDKFEEFVAKVSRKMQYILLQKKSISKQVAKLDHEYDYVYNSRLQLWEETVAEYSSNNDDTIRTTTSHSNRSADPVVTEAAPNTPQEASQSDLEHEEVVIHEMDKLQSSKENAANPDTELDESTNPIDIRKSVRSNKKQYAIALAKIENEAADSLKAMPDHQRREVNTTLEKISQDADFSKAKLEV